MKTCTICNTAKELEEFHVRSRNKDGRAAQCKSCKSTLDRKRFTRPEVKEKQLEANRDFRIKNRQKLYDYLIGHPCACGESDPACLQFDHNDPSTKSYNIGDQSNRKSWDNLKLEIDKCTVLCANCHAKRTAKQFGWYTSVVKNIEE